MGMDMNCRGVDGNCREIDLIQGSHPPYRNIEIKRERERERERCTNALRNWFILHSYLMLNYNHVFIGDQL